MRSGWSDKGEGVGGGIETELSTEQRAGVLKFVEGGLKKMDIGLF